MLAPIEKTGLSTNKISLKKAIQLMPNPTKEKVKKLYGEIGVDIFEGKKKITILSDKDYKKSHGLVNRLIKWCTGKGKLDYEETDSTNDLVLKYGYNNMSGTMEELEEKFGQEGKRVAKMFKIIGYFMT